MLILHLIEDILPALSTAGFMWWRGRNSKITSNEAPRANGTDRDAEWISAYREACTEMGIHCEYGECSSCEPCRKSLAEEARMLKAMREPDPQCKYCGFRNCHGSCSSYTRSSRLRA